MPYDPIQCQGQGHSSLKSVKIVNFEVYLLRQYECSQKTDGEL